MSKTHLFRSTHGVDHYMVEEAGKIHFAIQQDVAPVLERNKRMVTHNDGYSKSREFRRVASIPYSIMYKWLNEEGWWALDADKDPDVAKKLAAKLNSNEFEHLRTAEGRVGVQDGRIR